jgi:hypothetical protein
MSWLRLLAIPRVSHLQEDKQGIGSLMNISKYDYALYTLLKKIKGTLK